MICTCKHRSHLVSKDANGSWKQPLHQCEVCLGCYHDPARDKAWAEKYQSFTKKKK